MKTKLIAACVLASLSYWSVPMAVASVLRPHAPTSQHAPQAAPHHSCCPGLHPKFVPPVFVRLAPGTLPCDQHPCCVKQAPDNQPSLPAATNIPRPGLVGWVEIVPGEGGGRKRITADILRSNFPWPDSSRSTVLRI